MSNIEQEVLKQLKTFQKQFGHHRAYYVLKSFYAELVADYMLQNDLELANKYLNYYKLAKILVGSLK